jgi:hypothetical protein
MVLNFMNVCFIFTNSPLISFVCSKALVQPILVRNLKFMFMFSSIL